MKHTDIEIEMMKRYFSKSMRKFKLDYEKKHWELKSWLIIPNRFCKIEIRWYDVFVDDKHFCYCI